MNDAGASPGPNPHGPDNHPQKTRSQGDEKRERAQQGKDPWDKFSTLSTLLSTILIAAVGGYFTHRFEERQAEEQRRVQETQAVASLMQYLTGTDQQQRRAFRAIKVLGNTKLMVDLAASDPHAPAALEALRDVEFHAATPGEKDLAINVLREFEFAPSCALPFQEVAVDHPIDFSATSCGMFGSSTPGPLRAQNLVKNNFCAGTDFRDLSLSDFAALQHQAEPRVGGGSVTDLPIDRRPLRDLNNGRGEGSAVRFTGYLMRVHLENRESVNCHLSDPAAYDIHLDLASKPEEGDRCQSITAEISPHMRPEKWEVATLEPLSQDKVMVRISGQLMYDASHKACSGDSRPIPQRLSSWEIHPVYLIETCRTAQQGVCPAGQWTPLAPPPARD
jgi:hypothetical protein